MGISSADLAKLRGNNQTTRFVVNAFPTETVATALINQTTFAASFGEITVDNTSGWADIKVGQMVLVGTTSGGSDVMVATVRKTPTSTILYVDGQSPGNAGVARNIIEPIADNQYVTILSYMPPWAQLSRIFNRTFYKQYDVAYDSSGSNPNPIANPGVWQQADCSTTTGYASFTLSSTAFAHGSKTISTYAWVLPTGVSLVSGSLSSSSCTVQALPGFHEIKLTVTDSGSATHTAYTYLWANHPTEYPSLDQQYPCIIEDDTQDLKGRTMTLRVHGMEYVSNVIPGGAFFIKQVPTFEGSSLSSGVFVDSFVGYIDSENPQGNFEGRSTAFTLKSPALLFDVIPCVNQACFETASPANWTQIGLSYGRIDTAVWYILHHHVPNVFRTGGYNPSNDTLRKKQYGLNGSRVSEFVDQIVSLIGANCGSASDGTLYTRRNPCLEDNSFRTAMDARIPSDEPITEADILGEIEFNLNYRQRVGQFSAYAFVYGGSDPTAVGSIAPGVMQSPGVGKEEMQALIVTGQTELNQKSGHLYAAANAEIESFTVTMSRNFDVVDPAKHYNSWVYYDFSAQVDPRGVGFSGRGTVMSVTRTYDETDAGDVLPVIRWTIRPETYGQPGQTVPILRGEAGDNEDEFEASQPEKYVQATRQAAFAWNDGGYLARSFNWDDASVTWEDISYEMDGAVNDVVLDYFSERVRTAWASGGLGAWAVTTLDSTLYVYYCADILDDYPVWELQTTYLMADATVVTAARVVSSKTTEGLVGIAWKDLESVYVGRSDDSGATWDAGTQVGVTITDTVEDYELGFALDGDVFTVSAPSAADEYYVYKATGVAGSFAVIGNQPSAHGIPNPMLMPDENGILYVSGVGAGAAPDYDVTFDAGGYANYFITSASGGWDTTGEAAGGNPGDAAKGTLATFVGGAGIPRTIDLTVQITFPSAVTVTAISMDWKYSTSNYTSVSAAAYNPFTFAQDTVSTGASGGWGTYTATGSTYFPTDMSVSLTVTGTQDTGTPRPITIWIDNIQINVSGGGGGGGDSILYKVSSYASAPAWTDVTPTGTYVPRNAYGLAVNPVSVARLVTFVNNDASAGYREYSSTTTASAWSQVGSSGINYYGGFHTGAKLILWGNGVMGESTDSGATITSKIGNWAGGVAAVGVIRGVLPTL